MKKLYAFNALVARMKYITRWGLMRSHRAETLSEHTTDVAILAHTLCLISQKIFCTNVRSETVVVASIYHDVSEILTGDMPTPVKYKNENLRTAYKKLEKDAADTLTSLLPDELQVEVGSYMKGDILTDKEKQLLKVADRLSALIKCIEEKQSGNKEFEGAKKQQYNAIKNMNCPEAEYFITHMLDCYSKTLDELSKF